MAAKLYGWEEVGKLLGNSQASVVRLALMRTLPSKGKKLFKKYTRSPCHYFRARAGIEKSHTFTLVSNRLDCNGTLVVTESKLRKSNLQRTRLRPEMCRVESGLCGGLCSLSRADEVRLVT